MGPRHNAGFLAIVDDAKAQIEEVTTERVAQLQGDGDVFVLVDVREDREFAKDACLGAVHLGKGVLERDVEFRFPDKATRLVLYCGGGFRSALAALSLNKMGYNCVASMAGGFRQWCSEGRPTRGTEV